MVSDRVALVEANLDRCLEALDQPDRVLADDEVVGPGAGLTASGARDLFTDMVRSRVLDVLARELKAADRGYYTISSAGHEHNAVVGAALRTTDPAFLHYRSGGFVMARSRKDADVDPVRDTILSLMAAADDPVSGGRHKVWGSDSLWMPPQTSTIASHVPKAVGAAFALERMRRLGIAGPVPEDAIVVCSFGDASVNHATAQAGITSARYAHRRGSPVPVLFVCEDNGIGISTDTPKGWVAGSFGALPHLRYLRAGTELDQVAVVVAEAVRRCRSARQPVFLHLPTVRLWGHAGSDVESTYRPLRLITADEARDPLPAAARRLVHLGAATPEALVRIVARERERGQRSAQELTESRHLADRASVIAPLAPARPEAWRDQATGTVTPRRRAAHWRRSLPEDATTPTRRTMGAHLSAALRDELLRRPEAIVFGQDVGRKGGVYHVTAGLQAAFGGDRVFDTLLDETTILGVAQGAGLLGLLPICEIQYLAYVHNALDQLRGEAASLGFFSAGAYRNPMVVRIAGWAYQKGFGGHFHNDNAIGALRDIPGLVVVTPSRGDEAALLLRGAVAMAAADGRLVAFVEPIALYHEKDLLEPGDGGWLFDHPAPGRALLPGEVGVWTLDGGGRVVAADPTDADVLVVSYANGVRMALRASRVVPDIRVAVLDLRWLNPLPSAAVEAAADAAGRVLVADEARATGGGIADAVIAGLVEAGFTGPVASVRSADSYVPLGPAAATVLLGEDDITAAIRHLATR